MVPAGLGMAGLRGDQVGHISFHLRLSFFLGGCPFFFSGIPAFGTSLFKRRLQSCVWFALKGVFFSCAERAAKWELLYIYIYMGGNPDFRISPFQASLSMDKIQS